MKFRGLNGTIELINDTVRITREKLLDGVFHKKGVYNYPLASVVKVHYHKGGIANGFLTLEREESKLSRNVFSAMNNDDSIIFRMTKNEEAEKFSKDLNEVIKEQNPQ